MSRPATSMRVRLPVGLWPLTWLCLGLLGCGLPTPLPPNASPWIRHTIDDRFHGADGVKTGDVNGDGLLDLVVPWEESGIVTLHLNPGPSAALLPWPSVIVGRVGRPEDAVLVDLDGDGSLDVVSCTEGEVRTVFVHWGPRESADLLNPGAWQTVPLPASEGVQPWMFCEPLRQVGRHGPDLVVGGKGDHARIGLLRAPENPRDPSAWTWHPLAEAAWIMSIVPVDLDRDGDTDIVYSDRKGPARGVYWLENPGTPALPADWTRWLIGTADSEIMFLDVLPPAPGSPAVVVAALAERAALECVSTTDVRRPWASTRHDWPDRFGTGKGIRIGDLDGDGTRDIVFSCENAAGVHGVGRLATIGTSQVPFRIALPIGGRQGRKFDLVQLLDLDGDGDLDVVTTEESEGLGVIWFENPAIPR